MTVKTLLRLACISFSISSALGAPTDSLDKRETYTKEDLAKEFHGLYWDFAFEKDEDGNQECTTENLDVLVPALRKTKEFMGLLADSERKDFNSDGAWHQYYIRPNPKDKTIVEQDWNFNDETKAALKAINDNAKRAADFPFKGTSGNKAQTASVRCKEALPDGSKRCEDNKKLPAYTTQPLGTDSNTWITFCPLFFDDSVPKLEDLTNKPRKPADLGALRSREHILAHEFMHVKKFIAPDNKFVDDLKDDAGLPIYGESRCADFGWNQQDDQPSKVNVLQETNADTYGWWFTAVWFQTKNDWKYDIESTDRDAWPGTGTVAEFDDGTSDDGGVQGDPNSPTEPDPPADCLPLGGDCTHNFDGCCEGLCVEDKGIGALTCQ